MTTDGVEKAGGAGVGVIVGGGNVDIGRLPAAAARPSPNGR